MKAVRLFILLSVLILNINIGRCDTAAEAMQKVAAKVNSIPELTADFNVHNNQGEIYGNLSLAGKKFVLSTQAGTTWFDGERMWTTNPKTKEITLVNPTNEEINEVNPMTYLSGYTGRFNVFYSKKKIAGKNILLLNPKNKKDEVKAIEICINKSSMLPEHFIVRDKKDNLTYIYVKNLKLHKKIEKNYACPVNKMSGYELIDLR